MHIVTEWDLYSAEELDIRSANVYAFALASLR